MEPKGGAPLTAIGIQGLFGRASGRVALDKRQPTILTGANGTGKSTILRLVNAVSAGDYRVLMRAPITGLQLHFDNLPTFEMSRREADDSLVFTWGDEHRSLKLPESIEELPEWAANAFFEHQSGAAEWADVLERSARDGGASYSEFRRVRELFRDGLDGAAEADDYPNWFSDLRAQFPVLFVTDQRLVVEAEPGREKTGTGTHRKPRRLAVDAATADIAARIRHADSDYARSSQQQDRRFPRDVISAMGHGSETSLADVTALIAQVDARREALRQVGLLDSDDTFEPKLSTASLQRSEIRPVVATFLQATLSKLAVLEDLENRLTNLKTFLDKRFHPKKLILSRREGLRFMLPGGQFVSATQLSSGEQQMLVLAYEILFRAATKTLVIVDEPEISLHVLWQDSLIDDLVSMGRPSGLQYLMATHSVVILSQHPELERSLDAMLR